MPQLPDRTNEAPKPKENLKFEVEEIDMLQVQDVLKEIHDKGEAGVTGASVMLSWLQRRVQPLQQ